MYATCLFCHKSLGANETFETFPVGKRLAFDAAKGRLWVVCPSCERWNLSPLDERWEAIESAERLYRDTRKRVATDNIGLAKLHDGTTIVRIGSPLRPEFAAWRYGDQFGRRRNRQMLIAGGAVLGIGAVVAAGLTAGVAIVSSGFGLSQLAMNAIYGNPEGIVAKIPTTTYGVVQVRRRHLAETMIDRAADGSLAIDLRFKHGGARFEGAEAERVAAIVIPKVNRFGASKTGVADAVDAIEREGGPEGYLDRLTYVGSGYTYVSNPTVEDARRRQKRRRRRRHTFNEGLFGLPAEHRLALEMALHEETERRAMQGELAELERRWKDAEEIAGISDSLLIAPSVDEAFEEMKRTSR